MDNNLDEYIENIFLKLENNSNESQESICSFFNNKELIYDADIIEKGNFIIENLTKINDKETQSLLIKNERIKPTWENLITYYKKSKEFDETICGYLSFEHIYNILSKLPHINDSDVSIKTSFSKDLIKSEISDVSFSKLTYNLPFYYENGNEFIGISDLKMKSLIESKRITISTDNYTMINDEFGDLLIILLEKNAADFIKTIEDYELDNLIILEIINSKVFTTSQKLSIIEDTDDSILIENKELLLKISEFSLINRINGLSSNLLIELISNAISFKNKVELANKYFSIIEDNNLRIVIEKIGEPYSKLLLGKHPKVDNTSFNQELIKNLSDKLISKQKPTGDNKQVELFPYGISRI